MTEWEDAKKALEEIQPENRCYARVKALIRAGDKMKQRMKDCICPYIGTERECVIDGVLCSALYEEA